MMKVMLDKFGPIRRYTLVPSGDEPDYMRCTWGVVYLDLENGILSAVTDTGNYGLSLAGTRARFYAPDD